MKEWEFLSECGNRLLDVNIALENDSIADALVNRNDELVLQLLDSEF